ncbi:MAG TPA: hypothetical protein VGO03_00395 [Acidimicrobiia bacterium]
MTTRGVGGGANARTWIARFVVAAPTIIGVVVAASLWTKPWTPVGDWAAMWLRADDVFTVHTPLTGAYSTHNWNHPGPSIFWVVWALKRLSWNSVPRAFALMAVVNGLTLSATVVAARRWFGNAEALATALIAVLIAHSLGGRELGDFWNPYPPVVWLFAFAVGVIAIASRRRPQAWTWTIVFGSLAAQAHLSFLFLVVVLAVAATIGAWISRSEERGPKVPRGPVIAILTVFWLPVVIDTLFVTRNVDRIRRYLTLTHQQLGLPDAMHLLGREYALWGPLVVGGQPTGFGGVTAASTLWLLPAGVIGVAMVAAAVSRAPARVYVVPALALAGVSPFLAAGLEGFLFVYLVTFLVAAAAVFFWLALMTIVSFDAVPHAAVRAVGVVAIAAVVVVSAVWEPRNAQLPQQTWAPIIRTASAQFRARVGAPRRPIVVDYLDDEDGIVAPGIIATLAERYDVHTLDGSARLHKWGYVRGELPSRPYNAYTIIPVYPNGNLSPQNSCVLALHPHTVVATSALTPAQNKEYKALQLANLITHAKLPRGEAARLNSLADRSTQVFIVEGLFRQTC